MTSTPTTAENLVPWLVRRVAAMLDAPESQVRTDASFAELGLSSLQAVELSGDLEQLLGARLSPTLAYDYPTVQRLVDHLVEQSCAAGPPGDLP